MNYGEYSSIDAAHRLDKGPVNSSTFVSTDPVTGIIWFSVYTDDGMGNGLPILHIPLSQLTRLVASCNISV
jgi:hypothetical protein